MELYSYIRNLCDKGENTEVEFKSALGGFPGSFWETYSAFGNTAGASLSSASRRRTTPQVHSGSSDNRTGGEIQEAVLG